MVCSMRRPTGCAVGLPLLKAPIGLQSDDGRVSIAIGRYVCKSYSLANTTTANAVTSRHPSQSLPRCGELITKPASMPPPITATRLDDRAGLLELLDFPRQHGAAWQRRGVWY